MKNLSEMSLDELWHLFPIEIRPHNPLWADWYAEESEALRKLLAGKYDFQMNHVGSTSVKGISAKPIVDILILTNLESIAPISQELAANGWIIMNTAPDRIVLNKGYTPEGFAERVFHLHVKQFGDDKEVVFRDYMNAHSDDAKAYEALKLSLLPEYKYNRDGYTDAKTEFCNGIYEKAYKK